MILWRFQDKDNYWGLSIGAEQCQLQIWQGRVSQSIAISKKYHLQANTIHSLQILDDGQEFGLYLDGKLLFGQNFADTRLDNGNGVGLGAVEANSGQYFLSFEAHGLNIPIPTELDCGSPWTAKGTKVVINDNFDTGILGDLDGKTTNIGNGCTWCKETGRGKIELTGKGRVKVKATA